MTKAKPKKQGYNCSHIYDETWRASVYLIWPVTPEMFVHFLKHKFDHISESLPPCAGRYYELTTNEGESVNVIGMFKFRRGNDFDVSILSHECNHCAIQILRSRGVELSNKSEEAYTYLQESLLRRCMEAMR